MPIVRRDAPGVSGFLLLLPCSASSGSWRPAILPGAFSAVLSAMFVSVPMSLAGALVFFALGVVSVNIYTQIDLLALIGSIIRHGSLLVEFGNQVQREEGLDRRAAIEKAAGTRFRAIMMTTLATLVGMIPLLFESGPGGGKPVRHRLSARRRDGARHRVHPVHGAGVLRSCRVRAASGCDQRQPGRPR